VQQIEMSTLDSFTQSSGARRAIRPTRAEAFFLLLMLAIPLASSPPMQFHIVELPGAKFANLVAAAFAISWIYDLSWRRRAFTRLERSALIVFLAYILVFVIAFARSIPNLGRLHGMDPDTFPASVMEYALTSLAAPLVYASMFVYVLQNTVASDSISRLLQAIAVSVFLLSCVVITAVASRPETLNDTSRFAMAALTTDVLGLHYNSIGTIYIISGPVLLYLALKQGSFWSANYFIALLAVVLLESRTALLIFVATGAATAIAVGRARVLLTIMPLVVGVAVIAAGTLLVQLLTIGFTQHSGISLTTFLSARDTQIWLPLIFEWWRDPQRFWFGAGEYGILSSFLLYSGVVLAVAHSHNAYLDFFLDNGIVLEGLLLFAIGTFLFWSWRVGRRIKSQLYWVLFISVTAFLMAALTGRHFYPDQEDAFLFPILAVMISVVRRQRPPKDEEIATAAPKSQVVAQITRARD
jgi:hypothetical protein